MVRYLQCRVTDRMYTDTRVAAAQERQSMNDFLVNAIISYIKICDERRVVKGVLKDLTEAGEENPKKEA